MKSLVLAQPGSLALAIVALLLVTAVGCQGGATPTPKATATLQSIPTSASSRAQTAPIPKEALGPAVDPGKGYFVQEIRDGLYWVTDSVYQVMFLTTGQGVVAIDAPPQLGEKYLKAIAEVTDKPVTHVIYSHSHKDHIGAASMFPKNAITIAHEETAAQLTQANDPNRPIPKVTFKDTYTLKAGSQTLELAYKGPAHEPGNIFIYAPIQKVLMLVDVIFPGWTPFKGLAVAEDTPAYIRAHDQVLAYSFDTFIGGHVGRLGTRKDVEIQREYIQDIQAQAATALKTVDFSAIAQKTGFDNPWLLFDVYLNAVAQACTDAIVPKWTGRLGGVDVFSFDHCHKVMMSLRID